MLDFATRKFTMRLGRPAKSANAEQLNKRVSVVGRTTARRVSVRNSTLKRAPSGGVHRGTSVRRSQSAVRRGTSVKRAPSAARRNSKRMSAYVNGIPPSAPLRSSDAQPDLAQPLAEVLMPSVTSPTPSKSFFSKLTSRFRGRSNTPKSQLPPSPSGIATALSATNLAPLAPRSPSLRSPSPGSRVTFVDMPAQPTEVSPAEPSAISQPPLVSAEILATEPESASGPDIVDESDGQDDEWVDAEDELEVQVPADSDSPRASSVILRTDDSPECAFASEEVQVPETILLAFTQHEEPAEGAAQLHAQVLSDLARDSIGVDVRVSQWLAVTPVVVVGDEAVAVGDGRVRSLEGIIDGVEEDHVCAPKVESKRPRPPHIVVPSPSSHLSSKNPFRVPLPPSPSPPELPETNPFRSLASTRPTLTVQTSAEQEEGFVPPPSPSILLTPALDAFEFETRKSDELLAVDSTQFPLPPSPSLSHASSIHQQNDDAPVSASAPSVARTGSCSTSGGRSLSTTPSSRGPTTPTSASIRVPGHPALAHFSFGGPSSPSFKVEDWVESEDERRGRSLEVKDGGKRRMRSASPRLDAVLEGDESRRSSRASVDGVERKAGVEAEVVLPVVEEVVSFGRRSGDGEDGNEDGAGFFAFAERQMEEEEKKAARQLDVPKRSKTMSFLGFGKRKSTVVDMPPPTTSVTRSATSSRLGLPPTAPKRSSTLLAPLRSPTPLGEPLSPRIALSPTMYSIGDIHAETGKIEDEESRRLSEAVFMF